MSELDLNQVLFLTLTVLSKGVVTRNAERHFSGIFSDILGLAVVGTETTPSNTRYSTLSLGMRPLAEARLERPTLEALHECSHMGFVILTGNPSTPHISVTRIGFERLRTPPPQPYNSDIFLEYLRGVSRSTDIGHTMIIKNSTVGIAQQGNGNTVTGSVTVTAPSRAKVEQALSQIQDRLQDIPVGKREEVHGVLQELFEQAKALPASVAVASMKELVPTITDLVSPYLPLLVDSLTRLFAG